MPRAERHVLVAYDGSPSGRAALARVARLARPADAVTVVNVMPEPGVGARIDVSEERGLQEALLDDAVRCLARHGVRAERVAAVGGAAAGILAAAEQTGADVIVVGAGGRHALGGVGSTTARVARRATCDVLVVHGTPPHDSGRLRG